MPRKYMRPRYDLKEGDLYVNRTAPIYDYNYNRRCRIYCGKQIGLERFKHRLFVFDIELKEEDCEKIKDGDNKIRLLLHADEVLRILRYA